MMAQTFKQVIDRFPDRRQLATALQGPLETLDRSMNRIAGWSRRDSIPPGYWQSIDDAARQMGIRGASVRVMQTIADTRSRERRGCAARDPVSATTLRS